jgi:hypothetical protein
MDKKDKDEFTGLIVDALNDVVVPALDDMEARLASKEELQGFRKETEMHFDRLERKFDAQQDRLDRHDKRITRLEKKAGFAAS